MRHVLPVVLVVLAVAVAWWALAPAPQEEVEPPPVVDLTPPPARPSLPAPPPTSAVPSPMPLSDDDVPEGWTTVLCPAEADLPEEVPVSVLLVDGRGRLIGTPPDAPRTAAATAEGLQIPVPTDGRAVRIALDLPGLVVAGGTFPASAEGCAPVAFTETATVTGTVEGPAYDGHLEVVACGRPTVPYDGRRFLVEVPAEGPCTVVAGRVEGRLRDLGPAVTIDPSPGATVEVDLSVPEARRIPLGLDLRLTDEGARILRVRPDSPAAEADLAADDVIVRIDGQTVDASTGGAVRDLLTGRVGTSVRLELADGAVVEVHRAAPAPPAVRAP